MGSSCPPAPRERSGPLPRASSVSIIGARPPGSGFNLDGSTQRVKDILVPVNGTSVADEALTLACNLLRKSKNKVYAVYVIEVKRTLALDAEMIPEAQEAEGVLVRAEE